MSSLRDRVNNILQATGRETNVLRLITDVQTSVKRYAECVSQNEAAVKMLRFRETDITRYQDGVQRLDRLRHMAHERLIDSIRICNRYLFRTYGADDIPAGGIYPRDPLHLRFNSRDAIAAWAVSEAKNTEALLAH
jgi:hypothetical protein